jgi:histidinol-phosphate aminotransferase
MNADKKSAAPSPKPWIASIAAYVPGRSKADDGRKVTKLSANENPFGTGAKARQAFADASTDLATYPDPASTGLREAIAAVHSLESNRVICGTGSDELLHIAANAYAGPGDEIIHVRYGFSVYDIAARRIGATPVVAPDSDYGTDVKALLACVTDKTRVIFIANPNNPTGTFIARNELARLHAALPRNVLLVIDQAYAEYVEPEEDDGALELARNAPNVLITRTFSKIHGLAAERIGWGYAAAEIIDMLNRIRGPFNVTAAGQAAATAAIADDEWIQVCRAHNSKWRAWLAAEMEALGNHGLSVIPSKANFLLVLFKGALKAELVFQGLLKAGYAVRWLPNQGLADALRITIGSEKQMRDIVHTIRDMAEGKS